MQALQDSQVATAPYLNDLLTQLKAAQQGASSQEATKPGAALALRSTNYQGFFGTSPWHRAQRAAGTAALAEVPSPDANLRRLLGSARAFSGVSAGCPGAAFAGGVGIPMQTEFPYLARSLSGTIPAAGDTNANSSFMSSAANSQRSSQVGGRYSAGQVSDVRGFREPALADAFDVTVTNPDDGDSRESALAESLSSDSLSSGSLDVEILSNESLSRERSGRQLLARSSSKSVSGGGGTIGLAAQDGMTAQATITSLYVENLSLNVDGSVPPRYLSGANQVCRPLMCSVIRRR